MEKYLLDTDVIIWHLRGKKEVVEIFSKLAGIGRIYISVISRTEVSMGMQTSENSATKEFLSSLETCFIDDSIADLAGEYIRNYRKKGISLEIPDALIAATAVINNLVLVTFNSKHYPMEELRLFFER